MARGWHVKTISENGVSDRSMIPSIMDQNSEHQRHFEELGPGRLNLTLHGPWVLINGIAPRPQSINFLVICPLFDERKKQGTSTMEFLFRHSERVSQGKRLYMEW